MTVRVRFAPSPTGHLHIGGARTALYNYLFAQATGGKFILRIEDTDAERSEKKYEEALIDQLKWLGLDWDEGPGKEGSYGPYYQSQRFEIYQKHAESLLESAKAYHCFCTEEELEEKKERAKKEGRPPHYDGKCRNVSYEEATNRLAAGEKAVVRFRVPNKSMILNDKVRGRVVFPEGMVGDFVLMRSDGSPVYNFCCVIDDWLMKMTHVIRGDDHTSNTVRQLMIYEALGAEAPVFAHVSLLVGQDKAKLSKRHAATSLGQYKEDTYLPQAIVNYLTLLGWSHPEEKDIFDIHELRSKFDIERFNKAPAMFDLEKFRWVNGQHIKAMEIQKVLEECLDVIPEGHAFHRQSKDWQLKCVDLYKGQIHFFKEFIPLLDEIFREGIDSNDSELPEIKTFESTPSIAAYLNGELESLSEDFVTEETFNGWVSHIKKELKVKGRPLFKGVRAVLTGKGHGPELKFLVPLTPVSVLKTRVKALL